MSDAIRPEVGPDAVPAAAPGPLGVEAGTGSGAAQWAVDERAAAHVDSRLRRAGAAPWLHEEVGRRLDDKLAFLRIRPQRIVDWCSLGEHGSAALAARYPQAQRLLVRPPGEPAGETEGRGLRSWLERLRRGPGAPERVDAADLAPAAAQMVWANLALHAAATPMALLRRWHALLAVDGFLMFSTLGPDTLRELRALYGRCGFGPPAQVFRDMHDIGDMLVDAGFGDPVMDMERLRLTWADAPSLLADLRAWGGNAHPGRFAGCRTPRWHAALHAALERELRGSDGRLALSIEVVYGHAVKPLPRAKVAEHSTIALEDMRTMVRAGRAKKPDAGV